MTKKRRCVCDDTCAFKCKSRREHDLRNEPEVLKRKGPHGFIDERLSPRNPVIKSSLGKAIRELLEP